MYIVIVALFTVVGPVASIFVEASLLHDSTGLSLLIGKWFVFWAIGLRLFTAGLRQAVSPSFTAKILGINSKETLIVIQELGFANLSIGLVGICALFNPAWVMPSAIAGGLFLGLAGVRHIAKHERNRLENVAMLTDLFVFAALLVYVVAWVATPSFS